MNLQDVITIQERYQNSINLKLDIGNPQKINEYIPTKTSVQVLKQYVDIFLDAKKMGSTLLIGPYGKGKSHLMLVLLAILNQMEGADECIRRISSVDQATAEACHDMMSGHGKYLPVIISFGREELEQSYLVALNRSLKLYGLSDIQLATDYTEAITQIETWQEKYPDVYMQFGEKLCKSEISVEEFVLSLQQGNQETLQVFKKLYSDLLAGAIFNPMLSMDIMQIYQDVNYALCKEYGYEGIVIVFDEFSKFVEGQDKHNMSGDMKLIQDMCELANNAKNPRIYNIFIAHKSIKEYGNNLPHEVINAFTGIEGRLNEILFTSGTKSNYEIIRNVIQKKEGFEKYISKLPTEEILSENLSLRCFHGIFEQEDFREILVEGCFPLLPLTTYLLLRVSERVGQNERSLFTYLAKDEENTLRDYIRRNTSDSPFVSVDSIYDYFENIFQKDMTNQRFHEEWQKTALALAKTEIEDEIRMIKAIALLHMFDLGGEMIANDRYVRLALGMDTPHYVQIRDSLLQKQIIVSRPQTKSYNFKNDIGMNLQEEIEQVMNTKLRNRSIDEILHGITNMSYELPKRYNQNYAITRYFEYCFITWEEFMKMKSVNPLFKMRFSDGKILAIVDTIGGRENEVMNQTIKLADPRILTIYPRQAFDLYPIIERYRAIHMMLGDLELIADNRVIIEELQMLEEDVLFELNQELEKRYLPEKKQCQVYYADSAMDENAVFNHLLSNICENYYGQAPKVNNELINRKQITSQIRRARDIIITKLLTGEEVTLLHEGTGAENTIYRATLESTGLVGEGTVSESMRLVMNEIKNFIHRAENKECSFERLYKTLQGERFGMRAGVIPIYIAVAISNLDGTPVVYTGKKELTVSTDILNMINQQPEQYSLYVERGTSAKEEYIYQLEKMFEVPEVVVQNKLKRMYNVVEYMQKWYRSLPPYTMFCQYEKDEMVARLCHMLSRSEINPRQFLFAELPELLGKKEYRQNIEVLKKTVKKLNRHYDELVAYCIEKSKQLFGGEKSDSMVAVLNAWYGKYGINQKDTISDTVSTNLLRFISNISNNNTEEYLTNELAKIIIGLYMQDWRDDTKKDYKSQLAMVIKRMEAAGPTDDNTEGKRMIRFVNSEGEEIKKYLQLEENDSTMEFFTNAIISEAENFGSSLEKDQKVAALLDAIEQIINE